MTSTRPSLLALAAYIEGRTAWLATAEDDEGITTALTDCVEMTCLVMTTYTDIPLTFTTLANASMRLVRAERTRQTAERAIASVLRMLRQSAAYHGEQPSASTRPVSSAALREYFMNETTCPSPPPALPRRVRGRALDAKLSSPMQTRGALPPWLPKEYVVPDKASLPRIRDALREYQKRRAVGVAT